MQLYRLELMLCELAELAGISMRWTKGIKCRRIALSKSVEMKAGKNSLHQYQPSIVGNGTQKQIGTPFKKNLS